MLQYPDFSQFFLVTMDVSGYAIAGILSKDKVGQHKPCAYVSRLLNATEQRYNSYEKEGLVILYSKCQFRLYVHGKKFVVIFY